MTAIKRVAFAIAILLLVAMTATPANNAEQVIFSTSGWCCMTITGNSNNISSTPFGFWVWCAAEAAPNSKGGYQNANACQGSMYFYALDHNAKGIIGQVQEPSEGVYVMGVAQGSFPSILKGTFDPSKSDFLCTLTNPSPTPTHRVTVACQFGASLGGGVGLATNVDNSVVNVTGP